MESATTNLNPPPLMSLSPLGIDPLIQAAAAAAAMQAKVLAQTGISMPKYYNPLTVNPVQIAEQTRKRKLLWAGKKEEVRKRPVRGYEPIVDGTYTNELITITLYTSFLWICYA